MCGSRRGDRFRTPLKNHKNIGFSGNTGLNPLKNRSYQASIQCWVIIGTPAKRHLFVKVGLPLTKLSGSAHAIFGKEGSGTPVFKILSEPSVLSTM